MTDKNTRELLKVALAGNMPGPTEAEGFKYIRHNWGSVYVIVRPGRIDDTWKALAKFGNQDVLEAWSADGLLDLIRHHYGPETKGYTEMLVSKLGRKYS